MPFFQNYYFNYSFDSVLTLSFLKSFHDFKLWATDHPRGVTNYEEVMKSDCTLTEFNLVVKISTS